MFKIFTDSASDFNKTEAITSDLGIIPLYVSLDKVNYLREGVDITREEFFYQLETTKDLFPKTSQPSPQDYIDQFTPRLKKGLDIVYLSISAKLSGSHASAKLAADMLKEDFPERNVAVLDSKSASLGQSLILREMIKMRNNGHTLQETITYTEQVIASTKVYFTLDTLEYLKRGGRVGTTQAFVGGLLKLRPILHLEDGEVQSLEKVRGRKQAISMLEEAVAAALKEGKEKVNITFGHVLAKSDVTSFKENIEASLEMTIANPFTEIGVAIGAHAGPGALAIAYCKKYEVIAAENLFSKKEAV